MADSINPIEAIPGRSTVSRVLPMAESFVPRGQRPETDVLRVQEGKGTRSAGREDARGGDPGATRERQDGPTDHVDIAGLNKQQRIQYSYNEETGIVQTTVIEMGSDRVIRKLPTDQMIEIAKGLRAYLEAGRSSLGGAARVDAGQLPSPSEPQAGNR